MKKKYIMHVLLTKNTHTQHIHKKLQFIIKVNLIESFSRPRS